MEVTNDHEIKSTVIHGISTKIFLSESENLSLSREFHPRKGNSLLTDQNSICVFDFAKREFHGKGKFSLSDKKNWQKYCVLQ